MSFAAHASHLFELFVGQILAARQGVLNSDLRSLDHLDQELAQFQVRLFIGDLVCSSSFGVFG